MNVRSLGKIRKAIPCDGCEPEPIAHIKYILMTIDFFPLE